MPEWILGSSGSRAGFVFYSSEKKICRKRLIVTIHFFRDSVNIEVRDGRFRPDVHFPGKIIDGFEMTELPDCEGADFYENLFQRITGNNQEGKMKKEQKEKKSKKKSEKKHESSNSHEKLLLLKNNHGMEIS